jgi:hypothetical protein
MTYNIYASAVTLLATLLPPDLKAACDRILGPEASPHERWTLYDTAWTILSHGPEIEQVLTEVFHE